MVALSRDLVLRVCGAVFVLRRAVVCLCVARLGGGTRVRIGMGAASTAALHYAGQHGHAATAETLVALGADALAGAKYMMEGEMHDGSSRRREGGERSKARHEREYEALVRQDQRA